MGRGSMGVMEGVTRVSGRAPGVRSPRGVGGMDLTGRVRSPVAPMMMGVGLGG